MSWLINKLKGKTRGFFESFKTQTPKHERPDWMHFDFASYCDKFDEYVNNYPKVKSSVESIAGQSVSDGVFVVTPEDYDRAKEAKDRCDRFNKENCFMLGKRVNMDILAYETFYRMVTYGTCFWEKDFSHTNGLAVQLIPYQKFMTADFTEQGEIRAWQYRYHGQVYKEWSPEEIVVFACPPIKNPPFGTSRLTGIDYEVENQNTIRKNLNAYLEKQAFASNVLQVGDGNYMPSDTQVVNIETKVRNREVGEDFVTSYPTNLQVMGAAAIETRMIPDALEFTDTQITDALNTPPISKLYNSTEASATVMTDFMRAVSVGPLQRVFALTLEVDVYASFLDDLGFSSRVYPEVQFDPPDVHTNDEADYWTKLIAAEVVTPEQAAKKLGEEWDRAYWEKKKLEQQQQMQQQANQQKQEGKSWKVTELKHEEHKHE